MTRRSAALLLIALAALTAWPCARAHAQSPADVAAARELYIEGARLTKEKKWAEAKDRLVRSLELKRAPITHYSLAVVQQELGELVESLENFRAFLTAPREEATDSLRAHAERFVEELGTRVAKIRIHLLPAGLQELAVTVDGVVVPSAALDRERLVNPGEHLVEARAAGHHSARATFTVSEGEAAEVQLTLEPALQVSVEPAPAPAGPPPGGEVSGAERQPKEPVERQAEEPVGAFPVVPVVLLVTGAVAIGVGVTVGWIGVAEAEDAPTSDGPEADAALTKTITGDVVAGAGVAIAAVGVVWLIVAAASDDAGVDTAACGLHPWTSRSSAGIALSF